MQPKILSGAALVTWKHPRRCLRSVVAMLGLGLTAAACSDDLSDGDRVGAQSLAAFDASCEGTRPGGGDIDGGVAAPADAGRKLDAGGPQEPDASAGPVVRLHNVDPFPAANCGLAAIVTEYGTDFELSFEQLSLAGTKPFDAKVCTVSFDIEAPRDREVAIESFESEGSASLPAGTRAEIHTALESTDTSAPSKIQTFHGPLEGPVSTHTEYAGDSLSFSSCQGPVPMQFRLRVTLSSDGSTPAAIRLSKLGKLRFTTRPCSGQH